MPKRKVEIRLELLESKTVYEHVHGHHVDNQHGAQADARLSTLCVELARSQQLSAKLQDSA